MEGRRKLAFTCFVPNAVLGLAFGVVYLVSPAAMALHEGAVRGAFPALGTGTQALLVALMQVGGGVAAVAASFFLLARPLCACERWAATARVSEQLAMAAGVAYGVATVIVLSGAMPAWGASLASVLLPVAGWLVATHPGVRPLVPRRVR